jgi:hypothetical protein
MRAPVITEPAECLTFARDTWALEEARLMQDTGLFMYLQDITIVDDPLPVAPRLSALDHLNPMSETTVEWWEARRQQKLDQALQNESRVFCDPRFAKDASEQEKLSAQLGKKRQAAFANDPG